VSDGWFVVNVRDARWMTAENSEQKLLGSDCRFEGREAPFRQLGIKIRVLEPGQPNGIYHSENQQEDFLVLSGECRLLIEDEERLLGPWDFVHCPPGTHHILVGAGNRPCVILMVGARSADEQLHFPVSELAAQYGASVESETTDFGQVFPRFEPSRPERPSYWEQLPWGTDGPSRLRPHPGFRTRRRLVRCFETGELRNVTPAP
jgi:uncharacterized cupin superfamily protein